MLSVKMSTQASSCSVRRRNDKIVLILVCSSFLCNGYHTYCHGLVFLQGTNRMGAIKPSKKEGITSSSSSGSSLPMLNIEPTKRKAGQRRCLFAIASPVADPNSSSTSATMLNRASTNIKTTTPTDRLAIAKTGSRATTNAITKRNGRSAADSTSCPSGSSTCPPNKTIQDNMEGAVYGITSLLILSYLSILFYNTETSSLLQFSSAELCWAATNAYIVTLVAHFLRHETRVLEREQHHSHHDPVKNALKQYPIKSSVSTKATTKVTGTPKTTAKTTTTMLSSNSSKGFSDFLDFAADILKSRTVIASKGKTTSRKQLPKADFLWILKTFHHDTSKKKMSKKPISTATNGGAGTVARVSVRPSASITRKKI